MTAKIYVEGGGDGQLLDTLFRQGWSRFFEAAGLAGRMPRVVQHLASYKKPKYVRVVDALPRNGSGKVLKYRLRESFVPDAGAGPFVTR